MENKKKHWEWVKKIEKYNILFEKIEKQSAEKLEKCGIIFSRIPLQKVYEKETMRMRSVAEKNKKSRHERWTHV